MEGKYHLCIVLISVKSTLGSLNRYTSWALRSWSFLLVWPHLLIPLLMPFSRNNRKLADSLLTLYVTCLKVGLSQRPTGWAYHSAISCKSSALAATIYLKGAVLNFTLEPTPYIFEPDHLSPQPTISPPLKQQKLVTTWPLGPFTF